MSRNMYEELGREKKAANIANHCQKIGITAEQFAGMMQHPDAAEGLRKMVQASDKTLTRVLEMLREREAINK